MTSTHKQKLPVFNLGAIYKLRDKIHDAIGGFYHGQIVGRAFEDLVITVHSQLKSVKYPVVLASMEHLAGHDFSPVDGFELAWRLAGNIAKLRNDEPVLPWYTQAQDEWAPMQVRQYKPHTRDDKTHGGLFRIRVLAGTACPMVITRFWSHKLCKLIASRIGFSAPWQKYPFAHEMQLVNLRLMGQLSADYSRPGSPTFREIDCTASMQDHNKAILKKRYRVGWTCPNGWHHACHECRIGYQECPAGCHPATLSEKTDGPRCHAPEADECQSGDSPGAD